MIAINSKPAFQYPRTGIEEYAFQLLKHVALEIKAREIENKVVFYAPRPPFLEDFPQVPFRMLQAPYLWTQGRLALQLLWDMPDIFFNPEQILPHFAPQKSVITIHDIAYEIYPQFYPPLYRRYLHMVTKHAAKNAKRIIAVSKRTKRDISKYYGVPQRKIELIYHGFLSQKDSIKEDKKEEIWPVELPTKNPYLLFIGRIELKKNILALLDAFEIVLQKVSQPFSLLLAGMPGFGYEVIMRRALTSAVRDSIFFLGYVDKKIKSILYRNATVFVFPSLYEGFGLPILEAQSFGIPVVTSNASSLPEVVGEGGLLVDPFQPQEIAEKILVALTSSKMRHYLIKKGYENLTRFSWEKTAKQTLELLFSL